MIRAKSAATASPLLRNTVRRAVTMLLVALPILCWGGCAGKQAKPVSPSRLQAIGHNQRGVQAQAGGHGEEALAQFSEALRLQSSIENIDGMVVALINIARTQRLKGDLPAARETVERASLLFKEPSELASELFFEKAKILLAAGDLAAAKEWALRAEAAEKGGIRGGRANLVAAILWRQGLPDQAREQAEKALQLNRADQAAREEANSLRLLGEIHLTQGGNDRATDCYRDALSLDKELGLGRNIAADLRGLGAATRKSDIPGAIGFYRRAMEVSLNGGDASLADEDMIRLAELYRQNGEGVVAEKIEDTRKKLVTKKDAAL